MRVFRPTSWFLALLAGAFAIVAQHPQPPMPHRIAEWKAPSPQTGGTGDPLRPARFFTWGKDVHLWENGKPRRIASSPDGFDNGGCALDADHDGETDLILVRRAPGSSLGDLVILRGPAFQPEIIDSGVELHECTAAVLFDRSGFLMIHRRAQVRFYQFPTVRGGQWPVREIYSIYTASQQGGLALDDIDGDGRTDIYCGNYWVRAPEAFGLSWRIFAINAHHEAPEAASFRFAFWPGLLAAAQSERVSTPLRIFERPPDPRRLWPETSVPGLLLNHPRALLRRNGEIVVGEDSGLVLVDISSRAWRRTPAHAVLQLIPTSAGWIAVGDQAVSAWRR